SAVEEEHGLEARCGSPAGPGSTGSGARRGPEHPSAKNRMRPARSGPTVTALTATRAREEETMRHTPADDRRPVRVSRADAVVPDGVPSPHPHPIRASGRV